MTPGGMAAGPRAAPAHRYEARRLLVGGRVQGVGFRPFVYRLAARYGIQGWVRNKSGQVEILAQGMPAALDGFATDLVALAPPLARPEPVVTRTEPVTDIARFSILESRPSERPAVHVPPDFFTCEDCLRELGDPADRRYRYPFINCTQCGPRYTLIQSLPYDRPSTTMAAFPLCDDCAKEYSDPLDRRFHAEPVACPACGPALSFLAPRTEPDPGNAGALAACVGTLRAGGIVAVKGIGGYHLVCDARSDAAVAGLRATKPRPDKPLAVMFPAPVDDPSRVLRAACRPDADELALLASPVRPIVLVSKRRGTALSELLAPGLDAIGVMLPYSPLHALLLQAFAGPLVVTSANLSGEPVLTRAAEVESRLGHVANAFLHHDRPIARPADDPVYRKMQGGLRPLRLGRGCAPAELVLPCPLDRPVIATGGHMKTTIALAWDDRVVVSPHIGDMGTRRSARVFEQVVADLQNLYGVQAETVVCDSHPGYATTRWARRSGLPVIQVQHHMAHASALAGEHDHAGQWLVFAWDGVGRGPDGTLWGGEALLGRPGAWQRVASMRPFRLPGGEKAGREPWRSAAGICWQLGRDPGAIATGVDAAQLRLLHHAWQRKLNCPRTSAVGRLFDAAAAISGLCTRASYEGQGPMQLEAACTAKADPVELPLRRDANGIWVTDWEPLFVDLLDDAENGAVKAARFHATMAEALVQQALQIGRQASVDTIGLCGGVFQNRLLTERVADRLAALGFRVCLNRDIPLNDGGLSFGQIIEVAAASHGGSQPENAGK